MPILKQVPPHAEPDVGYFVPMSNDTHEISLRELVFVSAKYKWVIASITTIAVIVGVLIALLLTPVYRATVVAMPVTTEGPSGGLSQLFNQFGDLASFAGVNISGNRNVDETIAVLNSRQFVDQFVRQHNLMPLLFKDQWDAKKNQWSVTEDAVPTFHDAFELFHEEIRRVVKDKDTGLVRLQIEWFDNEAAAAWANLTIEQLNQTMRQRAIKESTANIKFLTEQLEETSKVDIQQVLFNLIETEMQNQMLLNVREQFALRVIDPAMVPDGDRYFKPNRHLIVALSLLVGLMISFVFVFLAYHFVPQRTASSVDES
ncbi:MAG: hypothetical protein HKM24_06015 [Gammaproteobacteria bacterium]|nr:hypothetical protein [Gammaproteobacteria bacterium]